jgi:uncharacterized membrane protein YkoI
MQPRYEIRAVRFFAVAGGFPRITEADLREGVGRARYDVSLAACLPYEVEVDAVTAHIAGVGKSS